MFFSKGKCIFCDKPNENGGSAGNGIFCGVRVKYKKCQGDCMLDVAHDGLEHKYYCDRCEKIHVWEGKKHWCDDMQIIISLIVIQYRFAYGNIYPKQLRDVLTNGVLDFSQSRVTKTMKYLKIGDTRRCTYCYNKEECDNYDCKFEGKDYTHDCHRHCKHLCRPCEEDSDCQKDHSFLNMKQAITDPRRYHLWISAIGLKFLQKWEDKYPKIIRNVVEKIT